MKSFKEILRLEVIYDMEEIKQLLDFADKLNDYIITEQEKLPYSFNIIDELHINENAHSRILCKLLQYNKDNDYPFVKQFLKYVAEKEKAKKEEQQTTFSKIVFNTIKVEPAETDRIDLWIRDPNINGYSIIIENKIYDANDQPGQLYRYITKNINKGYDKKKIYVIYLPSTINRDPDDQTWKNPEQTDNNKEDLKKEFESRFIKLSFKEDIISWLQDIYPSINPKQEALIDSAIFQYIDYLKGLYFERDNQKLLIMNIKEQILNHFDKDLENKTPEEKITFFEEKRNSINKLANQFDELILDSQIERQKSELEAKKNDFIQKNSYIDSQEKATTNGKWCLITIRPNLKIDEKQIEVTISQDSDAIKVADRKIYCQVAFENRNPGFPESFKKKLETYLPSGGSNKDWAIWKYFEPKDSPSEILELFSNVMLIINDCIKSQDNQTY
jgi:hypothetical protein